MLTTNTKHALKNAGALIVLGTAVRAQLVRSMLLVLIVLGLYQLSLRR